MFVIALTGGIASGKSFVTNRLKQLGAIVLDADEFSKRVVQPGEPALDEIRVMFGDEFIQKDGTLNRPALGRVVFSDNQKRQRLERIIHPKVRAGMNEELARLRREKPESVVVCDIPLLFETGMSLNQFERIVVVYAPKDEQLRRLVQRNQLSQDDAWMRINAQMPIEQKISLADDVVDNSGSPKHTLDQVDRLWRKWKAIQSLSQDS